MPIRELTASEEEFQCTSEPEFEFIGVRGNYMRTEDPEADRKAENEIIDRLERGDDSAWCRLTVTATWNGFTGFAGLGPCSFEDPDDPAIEAEYEDLRAAALDDLNANIVALEHCSRQSTNGRSGGFEVGSLLVLCP
jgi:hypothetical protein